MGDGRTGGGHIGFGALELGDHRGQGERHVRSGVAIGHRIHVETVDGLTMERQGIGEPGDERTEVSSGEGLLD